MDRKYIDRFWNRVGVKGKDDCWPYLRCKVKGYGQYYTGKRIQAHRFAYECEHGEGSAEGLMVCHSCDSPSCCNSKHLFLGTALDNMQDKHRKKRQVYFKGEELPQTKLDEKDVRKIKLAIKKRVNQRLIAKYYNVTPALVTCIKNGKAWKHVTI